MRPLDPEHSMAIPVAVSWVSPTRLPPRPAAVLTSSGSDLDPELKGKLNPSPNSILETIGYPGSIYSTRSLPQTQGNIYAKHTLN